VTRGDIFDDLFPPDRSPALKLKAELYSAVLKIARNYSQRQLEIILETEQPRISELLNGKIAHVSIEKLLDYAGKLGIEPRAYFPQKHEPAHLKAAMV
jgi:predicted XRE-type DNA-binding protein